MFCSSSTSALRTRVIGEKVNGIIGGGKSGGSFGRIPPPGVQVLNSCPVLLSKVLSLAGFGICWSALRELASSGKVICQKIDRR
jgi:hypothetical protein